MDYTNVVAEEFRQDLILHRHVRLAPDGIPEFRLDHAERAFDITQLVRRETQSASCPLVGPAISSRITRKRSRPARTRQEICHLRPRKMTFPLGHVATGIPVSPHAVKRVHLRSVVIHCTIRRFDESTMPNTLTTKVARELR